MRIRKRTIYDVLYIATYLGCSVLDVVAVFYLALSFGKIQTTSA